MAKLPWYIKYENNSLKFHLVWVIYQAIKIKIKSFVKRIAKMKSNVSHLFVVK